MLPNRPTPGTFALTIAVTCASISESSPATAQVIQLVSVSSTGALGDGPSGGLPTISPDGRFVAFGSLANNFAPIDLISYTVDSFVRDLTTGVTARVSTNLAGQQGDYHSYSGSVSVGGRFVAFTSSATNLVRKDTNQLDDIFVCDRQTGVVTRVSVSSLGQESDWTSSYPEISADGRFVVFSSGATNLVPNDTNARQDIFVHDRQTHTTTRVSVSSAGAQGNGNSWQWAKISDDGRYVAFPSDATNLVPNDTNGWTDIFVHDRQTGTTRLVSVGPGGIQGDNYAQYDVAISGNGRFVAFNSYATNLVPNDTNNQSDLFVHDLLTGTTTRENVTAAGGQVGYGPYFGADMSFDGRFIAFVDHDSGLVPGDTNGFLDVYVRDRATGIIRCASRSATGAFGNGDSNWPSISADGRYVLFQSLANNLVPGDTNNFGDVFVRDLGLPATGAPFCFGDGTGAPCPCLPVGGAGRGCPNSSFGAGSRLSGAGNAGALLGPDTLILTATEITGTALFFQSTGQLALGLGSSFGDGLLCVTGTVVRLGVVGAVGGTALLPNNSAPVPIGIVGGPIASGSTRYYQCWYRDALPYCQPTTFNTTPGLAVNWL
jgi:hypothetical protein